MGDFNHGPASPGMTWKAPFHYGLMNARGFVSPYVLYNGRCTFCGTNPLVARQGFIGDRIIDHIYVTTNTLKRVKAVKVRLITSMQSSYWPKQDIATHKLQ